MGSLDNSVVARLMSSCGVFEILLDPAIMDVAGRIERSDLPSYLIVDSVFKDANRGIRPAKSEVMDTFGTTDIEEIAARIVLGGKIQLTAEQRRRILDAKRGRIITRIADVVIDPKTGLPHPVKRIELALKESKFHVDVFKPIGEQVGDAIRAIGCLIPVELKEASVRMDNYVACHEDCLTLELQGEQKGGSSHPRR